ncbi:MAG: hypothetical protein HY644_07170 [Acidobacteria bacterium]|nr:hypothetical protein [Acidobacteriota bacterium]
MLAVLRQTILLIITATITAASIAAQQSHCADCHFANPNAPSYHLEEWEHSAHGRNNVGCEKCHGGDATTFELLQAHAGMLSMRNPASPISRRNLPSTCGACHTGPFVEFQKSKHFEFLREGSTEAPSCSTCHTGIGTRLLSPKALESQCAGCHATGKIAPRPEYPTHARLLLAQVRELRALLNEAKPVIGRIRNTEQRKSFEETYRQAEVPLIEAVHSGHSFVFDKLEERLGTSRQRTEALLDQISNPTPR